MSENKIHYESLIDEMKSNLEEIRDYLTNIDLFEHKRPVELPFEEIVRGDCFLLNKQKHQKMQSDLAYNFSRQRVISITDNPNILKYHGSIR